MKRTPNLNNGPYCFGYIAACEYGCFPLKQLKRMVATKLINFVRVGRTLKFAKRDLDAFNARNTSKSGLR